MPPVSPLTAGPGTRSTTTRSCSSPRATATASAHTSRIALPNGVRLVGGQAERRRWGPGPCRSGIDAAPAAAAGEARLPAAPLPLRRRRRPGPSAASEEAAAINPPAGKLHAGATRTSRAALESMWAPGDFGEMTKGAMMAFENDHGLTADGVAGPAGLERADHRGRQGPEQLDLRLHVRAGQRGHPRDRVDAGTTARPSSTGAGQHRDPVGADRAGHVRRVRARRCR